MESLNNAPLSAGGAAIKGGPQGRLLLEPEPGQSFFNFVFGFPEAARHELLNMLQYSTYAIIPIAVAVWVQTHLPAGAEGDGKQPLERIAEGLIQLGAATLQLWFIDRIVRYFPTWSGSPYHAFNYTFILAFLLAGALPHQDRVGAIITRLLGMVGIGADADHPTHREAMTTASPSTPPALAPAALGPPAPVATPGARAPLGPNDNSATRMPTQQQSPDFNAMYVHDNTPMPGAAAPGQALEPMAANSGGDAFSSW